MSGQVSMLDSVYVRMSCKCNLISLRCEHEIHYVDGKCSLKLLMYITICYKACFIHTLAKSEKSF